MGNAQSCAQKIEEAQRLYDLGNFTEMLNALSSCNSSEDR